MGNVNTTGSNESAPSGSSNIATLPGTLQEDTQEHSPVEPTHLDNGGLSPASSSSTQDDSSAPDTIRPQSTVLSYNADFPVGVANPSDIQSSLDKTLDTSIQSSDTSFTISESALPTTFDLPAEITCPNPNELPDYLTTPSYTQIGLADQAILSATTSPALVPIQTGSALGPSHNGHPALPAISLSKDALGSDCALVFAPDSEDGKQSPISLETKRCIEADMSHSSGIILNLSPEPFSTSAAHAPITPANSLKDILNIQPSVLSLDPKELDSSLYTSTHSSSRNLRESLAPIDNVVSVIADHLSTSQESGNYIDKEAILAGIPLAATYADAANLAAQHPDLAKELLSRPLLAPQARAYVVPEISYAVPDCATQDGKSRNQRRTSRSRRRGVRNGQSYSQSVSRPAQDSEESRHLPMRDGNAGIHEISSNNRRARLDLSSRIDREPQNFCQRNTGHSSQILQQDTTQTPQESYANASRDLSDEDGRKPSHDPWISEARLQFKTQQESISRTSSHEPRYTDAPYRSKVEERAPSHDPWLSGAQRADGSQDQVLGQQTISDETKHVNEPAIMDERAHPHDPWVSWNQSNSHIQVVQHPASGKTKNTDDPLRSPNADEWRPTHDPLASLSFPFKPGGLPGSRSRISHNDTSSTCAPDATRNQRQAPHDLQLTDQHINTAPKRNHHQPLPSFVRREHPLNVRPQPTGSVSSQSGGLRDPGPGVNAPDPYSNTRRQQVAGINLATRRYLRNKTESERRFSLAETRVPGQMRAESTIAEEPRSVSSPPRIVARLDEERPCELEDRHSPERPTTLSGPHEALQFGLPMNSGFRDVHVNAQNVNFIPEKKTRRSRTPMHIEPHTINPVSNSNLRPPRNSSRSDMHWPAKRDVAANDAIAPLLSNPNDNLHLASLSQNNVASYVSQYPTSSNGLYSSNLYPGAATAAHLQLGFDPRAEGWLANPDTRGRGLE